MTQKQKLEYAKKRYPIGSYYFCPYNGRVYEVKYSPRIHESVNVDGGKGYLYHSQKRKWAENCDKYGKIIPYVENKIIELW